MSLKFDKSKIDCSACFLVYMSLCGCVERTALAMDLDPEIVRALAESEGWEIKIRRVSLLSKGEKAGDYEKAVNRALNFAVAHQGRVLISKIIENLGKMGNEQLFGVCTQIKAGSVTHTARFFSDLAAALEKFSHLTYISLGDSTGERESKDGGEETLDLAGLHISVLAALNSPHSVGVEKKLLEDSVEDVVKSNIPPKK